MAGARFSARIPSVQDALRIAESPAPVAEPKNARGIEDASHVPLPNLQPQR
jgi:hypothetical protein